MLGRRLNPSLRERFTIVVAAAAFAFVARTASEALGASIPDGLYEALSEAPDVAAAGLDATLAGSLVLATSFAALGATTNEAALRALATNREIVLCAQEQKMPPLTYARRLYSKAAARTATITTPSIFSARAVRNRTNSFRKNLDFSRSSPRTGPSY